MTLAAAAEYQRTRTVKFSSLTLMKTDEMSRVISQAKTYYTALLFYFLFFQNNNLPDTFRRFPTTTRDITCPHHFHRNCFDSFIFPAV